MRIHVNFVRFRQIVILFAALGLVVLGLAEAAPVRAMEISDPCPPVSPPTGTSAIFGIDEQDLLGWSSQALCSAVATGVNWTRVAVSWNAIESHEGSYYWTGTDNTLNALVQGGLQPVVYIAGNPAWASPAYANGCGPIYTAKLDSFKEFITALVTQYPQIKVWALYNEPDYAGNGTISPCFGGTGKDTNGNPYYVDYANMLAAAKQAIQAADTGANPKPKLAVGAFAYDNFVKGATTCPPKYFGGCNDPSSVGGFDYSFPANLFKYIKANPVTSGYMDMVLFNYYDVYGSFWETLGKGRGVTAKANALRNVMIKAGLTPVNLLVSETGEHSLPDGKAEGVGLNGQAACLDITFTRGAAAKLDGIIWWTFQDGRPNPNWIYGLVDESFNLKPSYHAMQTLTTELNGFTFKKDVSNKITKKGTFTNVESYQFIAGTVNKYVVWSLPYLPTSDPSGLSHFHHYTSPCAWARKTANVTFKAKTLRVVDYLNKVTIIKDNKKGDKDKVVGTITIQLGNVANSGGQTPGNPTVPYPQIVQINPPAQ